MAGLKMTTIRLDGEDRSILRSLERLTGIHSNSEIIRMALREALKSRGYSPPMPGEREER